MDSSAFLHLVKNFTNPTESEGRDVAELASRYPFCQLIHLLYARTAKELGLPNQSDLLHTSAVYSTDRSVLKWVMTSPRAERVEHSVAESIPAQESIDFAFPQKEIDVSPPSIHEVRKDVKAADIPAAPVHVSDHEEKGPAGLTGDALRDDLFHELEKLQELKHKFEASVAEFQRANPTDPEARRKLKPAKEADPLLAEIKSSKKKLKAESPKQKEQNEIIDQFIKTKPVMPKVKPTAPAPDQDLSEESSIFSDNIVSETLVELLLKQGKKEKAIEVLKKLIWKFPQKKAYFAAQIEDLKN